MEREDWNSDDWGRFLTERLGLEVNVSFGRSRSAPVQARSARSRGADGSYIWEIRLHSMFASAPSDVCEALVKWLRVGRRATKAGPVLDRWIHDQIAALPPKVRRIHLAPEGEVHDLAALAEPLFEGEFAHEFDGTEPATEQPKITWGRRSRSRSRRSLRLGSFEPESRLVRVHPVLDQEAVPDWFVVFVLKHEILHAVIDAYRDESGRWVHHGPKFRQREESWPEYGPAMAWEQRNLARLIRSAREGTKLQVRPADLAWPGPGPWPQTVSRRVEPKRAPTPGAATHRPGDWARGIGPKDEGQPRKPATTPSPAQGELFDC